MTRWKSARFRVEPVHVSYPSHYRRAFACSILLCPQSHRQPLRTAFPLAGRLRIYHVLLTYHETGEVLSVRRWMFVCDGRREEPLILSTCLLAQAFQHLWLVGSHDVYRQFTFVDHTIQILAPNRLDASSRNVSSRVRCHLFEMRVHCPKSFAPSDYSNRTSW